MIFISGVIFPSQYSPEEGAVRLAVDEINNSTLLLPNHVVQYDSTTVSPNQLVHNDNSTEQSSTERQYYLSIETNEMGNNSPLLPEHQVQYIGNHTRLLAEFSSIQAGESYHSWRNISFSSYTAVEDLQTKISGIRPLHLRPNFFIFKQFFGENFAYPSIFGLHLLIENILDAPRKGRSTIYSFILLIDMNISLTYPRHNDIVPFPCMLKLLLKNTCFTGKQSTLNDFE